MWALLYSDCSEAEPGNSRRLYDAFPVGCAVAFKPGTGKRSPKPLSFPWRASDWHDIPGFRTKTGERLHRGAC